MRDSVWSSWTVRFVRQGSNCWDHSKWVQMHNHLTTMHWMQSSSYNKLLQLRLQCYLLPVHPTSCCCPSLSSYLSLACQLQLCPHRLAAPPQHTSSPAPVTLLFSTHHWLLATRSHQPRPQPFQSYQPKPHKMKSQQLESYSLHGLLWDHQLTSHWLRPYHLRIN